MTRWRVVLAYDGTDFAGWQSQPAARTVQDTLEAALSRLAGGEPVRVTGAGRTDAGVHALGQVAAFAVSRDWREPELVRALNAVLPPDARVLVACRVPEGFDPRRDAVSKLYRYVLDLGEVQLPGRRRFAGHVSRELDADAVAAVARLVLGRHDFASLASAGSEPATTVRTLHRSEVRFEPTPGLPGARSLVYEVEGDGFLRRMVRSLVGGLVAAGCGASSPAQLERALARRDRGAWPAPAEARGLTLVRVDYPTPVLT